MCLSLRTSGAPGISLHGPKYSVDLFEATKSFIALEEFDVVGHTNDDHVYEDNAILVQHVKLDSEKKVFAPVPVYSTWIPGMELQFTFEQANTPSLIVHTFFFKLINWTICDCS